MGPHQNLKCLLFHRHCQENGKAKHSLEKILQSIHLKKKKKDLYPEYTKNSPNIKEKIFANDVADEGLISKI